MNWPHGDTNAILKDFEGRFPSSRPNPPDEHIPLLLRDIAEQLVRQTDWRIAQHKQMVNISRSLCVLAIIAAGVAWRLFANT